MKTNLLFLIVITVVLATACSKSSDTGGSTPTTTCTWKTVFSDNFQRADTALGSNYMAVIQPTQHGGSGFADIYNNSLRISSDSVYWAIVYKPDVAGGKVRVSIQCTTPAKGGGIAFAVGGKGTLAGTAMQSEYFAGVMFNTLGIFRSASPGLITLASMPYTVQYNHTYTLTFTMDDLNLMVSIVDVTSQVTTTLATVETSTEFSGKTCTINGNSLGGQVVLLFNNFKIEACQ